MLKGKKGITFSFSICGNLSEIRIIQLHINSNLFGTLKYNKDTPILHKFFFHS